MSLLDQLIERTDALYASQEIELELEDFFEQAENEKSVYDALILFAIRYKNRGFMDVSLLIFNRLYAIRHSAKVVYEISKLFLQMAEYAQAYQWIQIILSKKLNERAQYVEIESLIGLENYALAKQKIANMIKNMPDDAQKSKPYVLMAKVTELLDNVSAAQSYYDLLYHYFFDEIDARAIRLKIIEAKFAQEVFHIQEVMDLLCDARLPISTSDEYLVLARAYQQVFEFDKAMECAKQAFALNHDNIDARYLYTQVNFEHQQVDIQSDLNWLARNMPVDREEALEIVKMSDQLRQQPTDTLDSSVLELALHHLEFIQEEESFIQLLHIIIDEYCRTNKVDEAFQLVEMTAEEFASPELLSYAYARVFEKKGDTQMALAYYEDALEIGLTSFGQESILFQYVRLLTEHGTQAQLQHFLQNVSIPDTLLEDEQANIAQLLQHIRSE